MRERARQLAVGGLDRVLAARGFQGDEAQRARGVLVDWARTRARAQRGRRAIAAGLRVLISRPGRAELQPFELLLAGPGEITVEVLASAISPGTERAQWLRLPNAQPPLPFEPGYSGAGRVLAVGRGVRGFAEGDLVAVPRARHASIVNVPAEWAVPVPDGVPPEQAALAYLAIISGYGVRRAGPVAGETVCVIGIGPIGALAIRLAALQEPAELVAVARTRRREEGALRGGASRLVTAGEPLGGIGAAAVIEATGDPDAIGAALEAARPGATVVSLGSPRGVSADAGIDSIQAKGLRLVGAHVSSLATLANRTGADPFGEIARLFLEAVSEDRVEAADLAGEAVDPREVGHFYRRLAAGDTGEAHLDWTLVPRSDRVRSVRRLALPRLRAEPAAFAPPGQPRAGEVAAPLRFAVIGCGDIGFANARAISQAAGAELALAHDASEPLAAAVADSFGGDVVPSVEAALDPSRADAVFLSVPHDLHAPLAAQAARAGLHVVVEKPLSTDLASGREAVAAAAAAGVRLSVCFSYRYHRAVQAARVLVEAGALGELRGVNVVFHTDKPASYWHGGFSGRAPSDWRASRARAGGGVLIMNLTHYVDLVRYLTGAEPLTVSGVERTDRGAEVEDSVALAIGWSDGAVGTISGSASTRGTPPNRFELWGDAGTLVLEPAPAIHTERVVDGVEPGAWTPLASEDERDVRCEFVERFAHAVAAGEQPDVSAADGLAVQAFVDAAYAAAASGERVAVEPAGGAGWAR